MVEEQKLSAYCVKCKAKQEIRDPQAVYTAAGTPGTRGQCSVCGGNVFKMGRTPAHANLPKPEIIAKPKRKKQSKKGKAKKGTTRKPRGKLVIVESPAKARTIGKFLGKGYTVKASVGHIRDLLRSQLSVDVENSFQPKYRVPNEKRPLLKELKKDSASAKEIYLATDADREGEAIAWHLLEAVEMEPEKTYRVVFHEITKDAIDEAFANPRTIDMDRVNAQQARRILDRLVGYKISPLLWQRVRSRTSAGRVQSVALRLICEREDEIDQFESQEYWSIDALLSKLDETLPLGERQFTVRLISKNDQSIDLHNNEETEQVVAELRQQSYQVQQVKRGQRRRKASAPFITSTLQQEASRGLGFGARRTMRIAQQLYEGIDLGEGETVGLITYMRTDSANVAAQAQAEARQLIARRYGDEFLPDAPPKHKTRSKGAQEAHEAIRPSDVWRQPADMKDYLSRDQYRLYNLIWLRFVASQMTDALYETMRADVTAGPYELRASGSRIKFPGFLSAYEDFADEDTVSDESGGLLPDLIEGEALNLVELQPNQHFTQPPPRYSEASLVKTLEEFSIGRPSTYAPTISTIQERGYVERFEKRLYPTDLGKIVNDLLVTYFPDIINVEFTAQMEEKLDQIAWGGQEWVPVLEEFYAPFEQDVQTAEANMPKVEVAEMPIGEACERCGHDLIIRYGRFGKFIACSNFPECRYTRPFVLKIGVACPKCGADLVERKTKKGRIFYGCSTYPECDWTNWKRPLPAPCPECGGLLVAQNKKFARCTVCGSQVELDSLPAPEEIVSNPESDQVPEMA
jgi:DNA topoisomerase-1